MRAFLAIAIYCLFAISPVFAQVGSIKTQSQLNAEIGANSCAVPGCYFPDETQGYITPYNTRQTLLDMTTTLFSTSPRTILTSNTIFYVNKDQGSDTNSCLSTGSGACATSAHVMSVIANNYDIGNNAVTIQYQCASYPCTYTQLPFTALQYVGAGSIAIAGNATADNIVMNITSAGTCIVCFQYVTGNWSISGFKLSSSLGSGNGNGIYVVGAESNVSFSNIDFGALAGGQHIAAIYGGQIQNTGNFTISGNAAYHMECSDSAVCHEAAGTATLTGTPTFSSSMFYAHGSGAVIGLGNIFSGSASGLSAAADGTSEIDVSAISNIPGTGTANIANSAVVGGFNGIPSIGGPLVDGGTSGSINLNGSTANTANFGTDANANLFQPSVPIQVPPQTYSQLTAAAGVDAYITDGKASNCGDSACTTWGTTITGGTGSLKLKIWYNGTNWTLIGK